MLSACPRGRKTYIIPILFQCSWQPESIKSNIPHQKGIFVWKCLFVKETCNSGGKCIPGAKMHFSMKRWLFVDSWCQKHQNCISFCSVSSKCLTKYVLSLKMCLPREKCRLSVKCEFVVKKLISCGFGNFCSGIAFLWKMSAPKDSGSHMYRKCNLRSGTS